MSKTRVLIIDRSNPFFLDWARALAGYFEQSDIQVLFLSDKAQSGIFGNLEIINVFDVPQHLSLTELQQKFSFSLYKTLVPERAFFDYSSFRRSQCYSRMSLDEIAHRVAPYFNALDVVIREKADVVIEGLADNFMSSAAGHISGHYGKSFGMIFMYYWWDDGFLMVDRMDQTSSVVDQKYAYYYKNFDEVDCAAMDVVFKSKHGNFQFPGSGVYPWLLRIKQVLNRRNSYEPLSLLNWVVRRASWTVSRALIRGFITHYTETQGEPFVLYPLHVSPEATLLGSSPELADQFGLIKNISMNLPYGVKLYVKEHPHQFVGLGLDYKFYQRVAELPNVCLFAAGVSIDKLWSDANCLAITVLSGTVGLEAAMQRKPVFVFGRPIYGVADCFIKPSSFEDFHQNLHLICQGKFSFNDRALYAILKALDASVIRAAGVKFSACRSWAELAMCSRPIYRTYLESIIRMSKK